MTVYSKYGKKLKILREEREIALPNFKDIVSSSTLSRFENGERMLKFDEADEILQRLGVSLQEYSYFLNEGKNEIFLEAFEEIDNAFYREDKKRLKEIFEENIKYPESRLIALSAKACYSTLLPEEQEEVGDYLIKIEHWGAKELWIFTDTIDQLTDEMIRSLLNDFLVRTNFYREIPDYNRLIIQAAINGASIAIKRGNQELSVFIINNVEKNLYEMDEYARTLLKFIRGYWFCTFDDKEYGEKLIQESFTVWKILNCQTLLSKYQEFYKTKILK